MRVLGHKVPPCLEDRCPKRYTGGNLASLVPSASPHFSESGCLWVPRNLMGEQFRAQRAFPFLVASPSWNPVTEIATWRVR